MSNVRAAAAVAALAVALGTLPVAHAQVGRFELEIRRPAAEWIVPLEQASVAIEGRAQVQGGGGPQDLFLVLDSSKSLRTRDPEDHRSAGAIGLVKALFWTDTHIGVVDFDRKAKLLSPLTGDRTAVMQAIRGLDQDGRTNLADGIRAALQGFEQGARPGASRMLLVFSDGRSSQKEALETIAEARRAGVTISTLQFGSDEQGESILRQIADGTGGGFLAVTDPALLPEAFQDLQSSGIDRVELRVNDSAPVRARLAGRSFSAQAPLVPGENRIAVTATSIDGRQMQQALVVTARAPGCSGLRVVAERDGVPALSISDRAVEIVVDASGSMRGRMDGRAKMEIAREILLDALGWLPPDLDLGVRAYGLQHDRSEENCQDTQLLVSPGRGNRAEIRSAILGLRPRGKTPLAYSLAQVAADLEGFAGERAVVLVTDGIENCEGDAPAAARALQDRGSLPVHVIGFGLAGESDQNLADMKALQAIAEASGGKFLTAGSADELRRALGTTVGTPYRVFRGDVPVGHGTLGGEERTPLPAGDYRVEIESSPPLALPVSLASEEDLTLVLRRSDRDGEGVVPAAVRAPAAYVACESAAAAR